MKTQPKRGIIFSVVKDRVECQINGGLSDVCGGGGGVRQQPKKQRTCRILIVILSKTFREITGENLDMAGREDTA